MDQGGCKMNITLEGAVGYDELNFQKRGGLIPAIVQNINGDVLYLQSVNLEAFKRIIETGKNWRFSKTLNELIMVGSESGKIEYVQGVYTNCNEDTLLLRVKQTKEFACHDGYRTCFYRQMDQNGLFMAAEERIIDPGTIYRYKGGKR
jgi:phosphoribosyl-AMP cyclohydrolase